MGEHCLKQDMGSAPFKFGFQKDYWPAMPKAKLNDFNNKYGDIIDQETIWSRLNKNYMMKIEQTTKDLSLKQIELNLGMFRSEIK